MVSVYFVGVATAFATATFLTTGLGARVGWTVAGAATGVGAGVGVAVVVSVEGAGAGVAAAIVFYFSSLLGSNAPSAFLM